MTSSEGSRCGGMVQANTQGQPGPSRRVSFLGKCQVILPVEYPSEDIVEEYFTRRDTSKASKSKSRLHLFRSKKNRSWSESEHDQNHHGKRITSPPPQAHMNRSNSAPLGASPLSPSLPISRDGTANRLRQKLVSPPPPASAEPQSPTLALRIPTQSPSTSFSQTSAPISPSLGSTAAELKAPMARPVAVRKPLTFGFDKDDEAEHDVSSKLQCPPIIYISSLPKQQQSIRGEQTEAKPSVLDWKDDADDSASPSSSSKSVDEEETEEDDIWADGQYDEEDLHGECTCLDCEQKMVAALSPSYQPQWTRGARRKYLADRKEAQDEQSRKAVRPPIWLTSEESEAAAAASPISETTALPFSPPSKVREICADEVDSKKGTVRRASIPKGVELSDGTMPGSGESAAALNASEDARLRKEVDEEVRLREEEYRLKKTRSEMRKLSADLGSGLRVGGGGARAMMRQLEEAEQAERRARFERSRSPKHPEEQLKEESIPMGAAIASVPTPPPRVHSPVVATDQAKPMSPAISSVKEKPARTPSPLKRALSLGKSNDNKALPTAAKQDTSGETVGRHPSPSLLIRRELALGIPVQSNANLNGKGRQSWHNSPKSGSPALEPAKSQTKTPSPRLTALNESSDAVEHEVQEQLKASSINHVTKPGMSRSYSMQAPGSASSRKIRSTSDEQPKRSVDLTRSQQTQAGDLAKPAFDSLRRSNTTGSRPFNAVPSSTSGALHSNHHSAAQNLVEARLDKAKAKARSSFRDLVARMKG